MRTREPAAAIWLSLIVSALGVDVWLLRTGRGSLSSYAGRTIGRRLAVGYLAAHLCRLGPRRLDVFSRLADKIRRPT